MNQVYHQYNDFEIISICIEDILDSVKYYARMYDFLFLIDGDQSTWMMYYQSGFTPIWYILEPNDSMIVHGWIEVFDSIQIRQWIEECIGVEERPEPHRFGFAIMPNPTTDRVRIAFPSAFSVTVYNPAGAMIFERSGKDRTEIDLSPFPEGVYIFRLRTGGEIFTRKVLKVR